MQYEGLNRFHLFGLSPSQSYLPGTHNGDKIGKSQAERDFSQEER